MFFVERLFQLCSQQEEEENESGKTIRKDFIVNLLMFSGQDLYKLLEQILLKEYDGVVEQLISLVIAVENPSTSLNSSSVSSSWQIPSSSSSNKVIELIYYSLLTLDVLFEQLQSDSSCYMKEERLKESIAQHQAFFVQHVCSAILFPSYSSSSNSNGHHITELSEEETTIYSQKKASAMMVIRLNKKIQATALQIIIRFLRDQSLKSTSGGNFDLLKFCSATLKRGLFLDEESSSSSSLDGLDELTLENIMLFSKYLLDEEKLSSNEVVKKFGNELFNIMIEKRGVLRFGITLTSFSMWKIDLKVAEHLRKCCFLNLVPHFVTGASKENLTQVLNLIQIMNQSGKLDDSMPLLVDRANRKSLFDQLLQESYMLLCQWYDEFFRVEGNSFVVDMRICEWLWESIADCLLWHAENFTGKRALFLLKRIILDTTNNYPYVSHSEPISSYLSTPFVSKDLIEKIKEGESKKKSKTKKGPKEEIVEIKLHDALQHQWKTFFMIYETLGNHSIHLITPVWGLVFELMPKQGNDKNYNYFIDQRFVKILWIRAMTHANLGVVKLAVHSMLDAYKTIQDYVMVQFENTLLRKNLLLDHTFICGSFMECASNSKLYTTKKDNIGEKIFLFFEAYFNACKSLGVEEYKSSICTFLTKFGSSRWSRISTSFFLLILSRLKLSGDEILSVTELAVFVDKVVVQQIVEQSLWLKLRLYSASLDIIFNCFSFEKLCNEDSEQTMEVLGRFFCSVASVDPLAYLSDPDMTRKIRQWLSNSQEHVITSMQGLLKKIINESTSENQAHLFTERFAALLYFVDWKKETISHQLASLLKFDCCEFAAVLGNLYTHTQMSSIVKIRLLNLLSCLINSNIFAESPCKEENALLEQVRENLMALLCTRSILEEVIMYIKSEILSVICTNLSEITSTYHQILRESNNSIFMYSSYERFKNLISALLSISQMVFKNKDSFAYFERETLVPIINLLQTSVMNYFSLLSQDLIEKIVNNIVNDSSEEELRNQHFGAATLFMNNITLRALCVSKFLAYALTFTRNGEHILQLFKVLPSLSYFVVKSNYYGYKKLLNEELDTLMKPNFLIACISDMKWGSLEPLSVLVFNQPLQIENEEISKLRESKEECTQFMDECIDCIDIMSNESTILVVNALKYVIHHMLIQNSLGKDFITSSQLKRIISITWGILKGSTDSEGGTHGHRYTNEHVNITAFFEIMLDFEICKDASWYAELQISQLFEKIINEYSKTVVKVGTILGLQFIKLLGSNQWRNYKGDQSRKHLLNDFMTLIFYCPEVSEDDEYEEAEKGFKSFLTISQENPNYSRNLLYTPMFHAVKILRAAMFYMADSIDANLDRSFLYALTDSLIDINISSFYMKKPSCMPGSPKHYKKLRIWQLLGLLAPKIDLEMLNDLKLLNEDGSGRVWTCIFLDNPPSVRKIQELFALVIMLKFPSLGIKSMLHHLREDINQRQQYIGSVVSLVGNVLIYASEDLLLSDSNIEKETWLTLLLNGLFVYATSNHHTVRVITHIMLRNVLYRMEEMSNKRGQEILKNNELLKQVYQFLHSAQNIQKWLGKYESLIVVDPVKCTQQLYLNYYYEGTSLINDNPNIDHLKGVKDNIDLIIYSLFYLTNVGITKTSILVEKLFTPQFGVSSMTAIMEPLLKREQVIPTVGSIDDFTASAVVSHVADKLVKEWASEFLPPSKSIEERRNPSTMFFKGIASVFDSSIIDKFRVKFGLTDDMEIVQMGEEPTNNNEEEECQDEQDNTTLNFQTKFVPWSEMEIQNELNPRSLLQHKNGQRQSIIVIASLIDKIPNLAGLARTCEIFSAEKLVLPHMNVVEMEEFKSISVSAEHWIPVEACPPPELAQYLSQKRQEGYTIVGLEQTSTSVMLPDYEFPERCCICLGNEKEGMPPELLSLMDTCVEIPQLGVLRSLNVHVSASIMIYRYTEQFLRRK